MPIDETSRLKELHDLKLDGVVSQLEFDNLTQLAGEICDAPVAMVSFVDQDIVWFKSKVGFDAPQAPREYAFCSQVIEGVAPMIVEDASADPRFQKNEVVQAPQGIRFYAGVPLVLGSGFVVGTLCVMDYKVRTLSEKELNSLAKLAGQVIALIEARRTQLRLLMQESSRLVSEERLDFALKAAEIGDWDMDLRTNVARRSFLHDRCFGYTEAVPVWGYDTFLAHIIEADRTRVDGCFQRAMAGQGAYDVEFQVIWPDQTVHWLWSKGRFYFDDADKPNRVAGIQVDITERKKIEAALRETEQNFRALAEASSEIPYRMSADWSTMLPLDGRGLFESSDSPLSHWAWVEQYLPREEHARVRQIVSDAIARKKLFEMEHRVLRVDGSTGWTRSRAVPILDENEALVTWFGAASDITERKRIEEEMRLLASIVENSRDFIGIADTHGNPVYGNRAAIKLVGLKNIEEVRRIKVIDYFIAEQRQFVEEVVLPTAAKDGRWAGELTMQHFVTGATIPVWYDLFRVDDRVTGQPVNLATITRDLTEPKQGERALAERTELLNGVLEGTTDLIFVKDLNGRCMMANAEFAALFSSSPEQLVGKTTEELLPPDLAAEMLQHDEAVIAGGRPIQREETILVAGEVRVFLTLKAPLRDAGSRVIGILGISRDITERKQAQQDLQQSLKDKESLLMEVHHRVKNNLQVIASLLRMEAHRSQQVDTKAVLTDMQGRIRSMALLHKTLYRSGTFASADLGSYLKQVASQAFGTQLQSADLVRLTLRLGSVQVGMDQAISAGLLVNELISNCLKHAFPQQRAGEVSVVFQPVDADAEATDTQWRLCISDTGVGLPPDFEQRRKTSLGLQLVDDLGQQIGGSLMIESQPGQGTQFTLIFTTLAPKSLVMPL